MALYSCGMRILLTNDDGIDAPGLHALREIARQLSEDIWVVAPETNQSGASHSLTLHEPLRMRLLDERAFAVRGTPTDSVIMGVRHVLKDKPPDLVLSGVNRGGNMAEDVTYSGTIAGAFEGTILGIRSIALSQAFGFERGQDVRWQTGIAHGPGLIRKLLATGMGAVDVDEHQLPRPRARRGGGTVRHQPGQARSGPAAHRRAPRYLGQSLLLAGLRAPPLQHQRAPTCGPSMPGGFPSRRSTWI